MVLCKCGCGGEIISKSFHSWYGTPEYKRGHYNRGKKNPTIVEMNKKRKGVPSKKRGTKLSEKTKELISLNHHDVSGPNHPNYGNRGKESFNWKGGKKLTNQRHNTKRRNLGNEILNGSFEECEGHHINPNQIINIPKELHNSIYHNVHNGFNMKRINMLVKEWYIKTYGIRE